MSINLVNYVIHIVQTKLSHPVTYNFPALFPLCVTSRKIT